MPRVELHEKVVFVIILPILLIGCRLNTMSLSKANSPSVCASSEIAQTSLPSSKREDCPINDRFLISERGIGSAQLGTTIKQLKEKLGTDTQYQIISPFMVDFDAIAVYQSGIVQYYILYPSGETFSDSDLIESVLTDNQNYRTAEGIRPKTSLKQAETVYGEAILFYNTQNESREQVRFANYSQSNISFQPTVPNQSFVGIYPLPSGQYNETNKFQKQAVIRSVIVSH
jgi:hypothetical protein